MTRAAAVLVLALLALAAPAVARAQDAPVATVDGAGVVAVEEFEHWLLIAAKSSNLERVPPKGSARYRDLRRQVMELLVQNLWVEGEAAARGIVVTDEEVERAVREQRRQAFPDDREWRAFLRDSGYTLDDIRYRVRLEQLSNLVRRSVLDTVAPPTPEDARAYYEEHREDFVRPQTRRVQMLHARTRDAAERARAAIADGTTFRAAARRVGAPASTTSIERPRSPGGVVRAIFAAPRGEVRGPVRSGGRWVVFRVLEVRPERQLSYEQARSLITEVVLAERQQEVLDAFIAEFQRRWKARTTCRSAYAARDCGRIAD